MQTIDTPVLLVDRSSGETLLDISADLSGEALESIIKTGQAQWGMDGVHAGQENDLYPDCYRGDGSDNTATWFWTLDLFQI